MAMRWAAAVRRTRNPLSSGDADLPIGLPETKLGIMPGFGGSVPATYAGCR
ncbi:hypothetical protein ACNKHO_24635 [Shigella flexneri]